MRILFLFTSSSHPSGDVRIPFEIANGLAREGDEVHIVHLPLPGRPGFAPDDLAWFPWEGSIHHHFDLDGWQADYHGDISFNIASDEYGLPAFIWSAYALMPDANLEHNSPKICLSSFLAGRCRDRGIPENRIHVFRPAVDHGTFTITRGLADRGRRVAMHWSTLPGGRPEVGLAVCEEVRRRLPDTDVVIFGADPAPAELPSWCSYLEAPDVLTVADEVYNPSSVFLSAADIEGVAWSSIEAVACGCALVTTRSGGSGDVARADETALIADPGDVAALADHVVALLVDDERRIELATAGAEFVQPFSWVGSSRRLHAYLEHYQRKADVFRKPRRRRQLA